MIACVWKEIKGGYLATLQRTVGLGALLASLVPAGTGTWGRGHIPLSLAVSRALSWHRWEVQAAKSALTSRNPPRSVVAWHPTRAPPLGCCGELCFALGHENVKEPPDTHVAGA